MTNWEYYIDEIKGMVENASLVAVVDDKPVVCQDIDCSTCDFYHAHKGGCQAQLKEWLNTEYCPFKEGELVEVKVYPTSCWELRKFCREEKGVSFVYCDYAYEDVERVSEVRKYGSFAKFLQELEKAEEEDE